MNEAFNTFLSIIKYEEEETKYSSFEENIDNEMRKQ